MNLSSVEWWKVNVCWPEAAQPPSSEILKSRLDKAVSNQVWPRSWPYFEQMLDQRPPKNPFSLNDPMILMTTFSQVTREWHWPLQNGSNHLRHMDIFQPNTFQNKNHGNFFERVEAGKMPSDNYCCPRKKSAAGSSGLAGPCRASWLRDSSVEHQAQLSLSTLILTF